MRTCAMILVEVGAFSRFDPPDKVLAYAGLSPFTYRSGQLNNCYAHMEKRGSRYLRFPFITPPSTSAFGTAPLPHTLPRNEQRTSTTMWPYPLPPRNWYDSSTQWRSPGFLTSQWLLYNSFQHLLPWCPHRHLLPCAILHRLVFLHCAV